MSKRNLIAVVDVGSNLLTMKIAELRGVKAPKVIETLRGSLALGEDTYRMGRIGEEAIEKCCEILQKFRFKLKEYGLEAARVVATSAVREAENRDYVLNRIYQSSGFRIDILDDSVECWWRLLAALERMRDYRDLRHKDLRILDIGAGSIHLSQLRHGSLIKSSTVLLGALRMAGMLEDLRLKSERPMSAFSAYLKSGLKREDAVNDTNRDAPVDALIVLADECRYFKKIAGLKREDTEISREDFNAMLRALRDLPAAEAELRYGLSSQNTRQLLPAALVIREELERGAAARLFMPEADLCQGLLCEAAERMHRYEAPFRVSDFALPQAEYFALRCGGRERRIQRTVAAAGLIFDCVKKRYGLEERTGLYLRLAAILMHVGAFIREPRHGAISFQMIRALEIIGVSQKERERIAYIAEHANTIRLPMRQDMIHLPGVYRQEIINLSAILRIAETLGFDETSELILDKCTIREHELVLSIKSREEIDLQLYLIRQAAQLFEQAYGLKVRLVRRGEKERSTV